MQKKSSRSAESVPLWARQLGAAVRHRRKLLRLTQKQLAELSGCGPDFLYDLERGKPTLRLEKLVAVLEALGLKLEVKVEPRGLGKVGEGGGWISE